MLLFWERLLNLIHIFARVFLRIFTQIWLTHFSSPDFFGEPPEFCCQVGSRLVRECRKWGTAQQWLGLPLKLCTFFFWCFLMGVSFLILVAVCEKSDFSIGLKRWKLYNKKHCDQRNLDKQRWRFVDFLKKLRNTTGRWVLLWHCSHATPQLKMLFGCDVFVNQNKTATGWWGPFIGHL